MNIIDTIFHSNIINFLIVVWFLAWLFGKFKVFSFVGKRREEIAENIKNLEEDKQAKKEQLEATQTRVKNLDQEVDKMKKDGEQVAENICGRIIEEAHNEAAELDRKAQFTLESERKLATTHVMQEVATTAFSKAEERINHSIDEKKHKQYINEFIESLGELA